MKSGMSCFEGEREGCKTKPEEEEITFSYNRFIGHFSISFYFINLPNILN